MTDFIILIAYLALLCRIGLGSGKARSMQDFSHREVGLFALTATLSASFIGGGFSSGNAAQCAAGGLGAALTLCGFTAGWLVLSLLVGRMRFPAGVSTAGGILGAAYGQSAQLAAGVLSFFLSAAIVGAQITVMGSLFQAFLHIPRLWGILCGTAVAVIYSTFGGIGAVIRADVVQFIVLAVGMPLLAALSLRHVGGFSALPAASLQVQLTPAAISVFLAMGLGEFLSPPGLQRLSAGSRRTAGRAVGISAAISLPFFLLTGLVGVCAALCLPQSALSGAMEAMIDRVAPTGVRGVLIAAVFSAVLSTADSFLNSASVCLVNDIAKPLRPHLSDRGALRLARISNVAAGAAAAGVAAAFPDALAAVSFAYAFWSPVLLTPLCGVLLGRPAPRCAFWASVAAGGGAVALWRFVLREPYGISAVPVGFFAGLFAYFIAKLLFSSQKCPNHS